MEFNLIILCLLLAALTPVHSEDDGPVTFVAELSSKPSQKLSRYGWFGSARLQKFHIPEDAAVARWQFTVSKGNSFHGFCGDHNVTIHIRWGAPPVVDPVGQLFPADTQWSPAHSLHLPVTSQATVTFNLSDPSPGDWYVAAHLPRDDGRIEQKGFPSCSYYFQPQLSIRRALDTPILQEASGLLQAAAPDKPARLKLFVPEFVSSLTVSVSGCVAPPGGGACQLVLRLGSASASHGALVAANCSTAGCSATLLAPPWRAWLRVVVESVGDNRTVTFNVSATHTVSCKPKSVGLAPDVFGAHGNNNNNSNSSSNSSAGVEVVAPGNWSAAPVPPLPACVWSVPVLAEELDVLAVRFSPAGGANVSVGRSNPTLLTYPLLGPTSGGTLSLQLTLNDTADVSLGNSSSVVACLSPWSPVLSLNSSQPCQTALFRGYSLHVNSSVPKAVIRLPFPQTATWYLTLQLVCNSTTECGGVSVVSVVPEVSVSACVEDCGPYGECRLLRSYTYLYSACVCKAGWTGWGCTDGSAALSYGRQLVATLLLTLSNLLFLPAVLVAASRCYVAEASVYLFTMFFSTFYHACDQPGVAVMCIMDYDTLQFCDFLGSVCSIWVTILCMARVRDTLKYTLFMLGALLIAMSMQLDRRGLWNMLGPVLCAVLAMVTAWVYRGVRRRHCYPPSWRRWLLYLAPGLLCVLVGVCVYIFAETEDNYYYTHSLWHVLVACSVALLLPPRERSREAWGWSRGWAGAWSGAWSPRVCGYTLCHSSKEELYTVS